MGGSATPAANAAVGYFTGGSYDTAKKVKETAEAPAEEARKQTQLMREQQESLIAEAKEKEEKEVSTDIALKKRAADRARQRSMSAATGGRQGTVLTSPLGIPGGDAGTKKSLLGT